MTQVGINKQINGIDLLVWFQNKHLLLDNQEEGLSLKTSQEIQDKIPNIQKIVKEFLYSINDLEYTIGEDIIDTSGSDIQE